MKKIVLLFLFLIGRIHLNAQVFDQSVINTLQTCIQQKQFEKADSIINSFRDKNLPETSVFWLNLIHSDVGVSKYRQSRDANAYLPYVQSGIDAFNFLSHNINKENASISLDLWSFLFYWSDIFTQLDNKIIDSLSVFSNKYYNDYERKDHALYYLVQRNIYQYYFDKQEWRKCINVMSQVEKGISDNSAAVEQTAYSRFDIGQAYMNMEDFYSAEKWYISSYNAFSSISNREDDETYGCLLLLLSKLYFEHVRSLDKAYEFSLEAERVSKKIFGEGSKAHIASLDFLTGSELNLGKNKTGIEHLDKIKMLLNKTHDLNEAEKQSYFDKLKYAYLRLNINKDVASQDTIVTDNSILLDATNAFAQGNIKEAVSKFSYLLQIYENNFKSVDLPNYVYVVGSLSNVLVADGKYNEADIVLDRSLNFIQEKNMKSVLIRGLYMAKGLLYFNLNNVEKALYWYNLAKDTFEKSETKGLDYALLASNLSTCYYQKGELTIAKQLSDEAYDACSSFYGENANDANDRLLIMNNIANIYTKIKEISRAKDIYRNVVELAVTPQTEKTKALALANLGELYWYYEQNYEEAEKALSQVRTMDAASYVKELAELNIQLIHCLNKNDSAILEMSSINTNIKNGMAEVFAHFSEAEREKYWEQKSQMLVLLNNIAVTSFDNKEVRMMAYDNALYTKSMLLNSGRLLEGIAKQASLDIKKDFESMQNLKKTLSLKSTPKDSVERLIEDISLHEKRIVASIPNFREQLKAQFKSMDDVKAMLSSDEVAIEFIFLPRIKFPIEKTELQYGALMITKNSDAPILIPLCFEREIKELFDVDNSTSQENVDILYSIMDQRLFNMLWSNIDPYLSNVKTIYYSPTGYLSKLNISAISNGSQRLSEKYDIFEVSTTAMIGEIKQNAEVLVSNAVLFGDINYFEDSEMMAENAKKYKNYSSGNLLATRSLDRNTWELLPGTKDEITNIEKLMKSKNINSHVICQNNASEESFKAMDGNAPDIIHVATHGFYLSQKDDITSSFFVNLNSYTQKDYSMFFSGLLFAGANNAWIGKELNDGIEDGILTADELSRIDLKGCKLVVLSACNTGLGDINNVDGVFGLQRGFKKAGASTILMSLWKVPDEETGILMKYFYQYFLSGKSAHQSLRLAQDKLIEFGKSPYYWAGFILLD